MEEEGKEEGLPFHHYFHHKDHLVSLEYHQKQCIQWSQDRIHKIGISVFSGYHLVSEVPRMDCVCLLWLLHKFHFLTAPVATTGRVS